MRSNERYEDMSKSRRAAVALCAAAALAQGCGDDAGAGSATSSSATSSTATSGSGGAGGGGGSGGAGGGGSGGAGGDGGGGGVACLDAQSYSALFSLNDAALCAVAVYTTDLQVGSAATWGRHGGPLLLQENAQQGSVNLVRLTPPAGSTGRLAKASRTIAAGVPAGTFLGSQAVDLSFFGWTAISWTNPFPNPLGEVILLDASAVAKRYEVNGFFAAAAVDGRLLYTGLSEIDAPGAGANGLFAADSCGAAGQDPRLLPGSDSSCTAPAAVAAWGDYSGPIAADRSGNVFAVLVKATGEQEARGFAATTVAHGAGPAAGDVVFTLPGGGVGLAAVAPDGDAPGVLVFQPTDAGPPYGPLDPIAVAYRAAGVGVQVDGSPAPLLHLATAGTSIALVSDDADRLWVGTPSAAGGGTTFVVLARR